MTTKTITVPRDYTLDNTIKFVNSLNDAPEVDEYIFDFQDPGFLTPFGMLFIACAIRSFLNNRNESHVIPTNYENYYAGHMGFSQACGFEIGKIPGEAKGSSSYLPITIVNIADLLEEARTELVEIGEVIEMRSKELSKVLTQQENGTIIDMITYVLREMIRNAIEHSESEFVAYSAQYMPRSKRAEIAILDTGIGIRKSLSNNPYLTMNNDRDAINYALMPGVSGKMFKGVKRDPYSIWQNSGYGLYGVSRLCGIGGKFFICSGNVGLSLKPKKRAYYETQFQGTALRLNLSPKNINHLHPVLSGIMKEGDKFARQVSGDEDIPASTASQMLASEFRKKH